MKYIVEYVRIENQVYTLEIEADSKEEAEEIAEEEFTGDEPCKIVHAEEFIHEIRELKK